MLGGAESLWLNPLHLIKEAQVEGDMKDRKGYAARQEQDGLTCYKGPSYAGEEPEVSGRKQICTKGPGQSPLHLQLKAFQETSSAEGCRYRHSSLISTLAIVLTVFAPAFLSAVYY